MLAVSEAKIKMLAVSEAKIKIRIQATGNNWPHNLLTQFTHRLAEEEEAIAWQKSLIRISKGKRRWSTDRQNTKLYCNGRAADDATTLSKMGSEFTAKVT